MKIYKPFQVTLRCVLSGHHYLPEKKEAKHYLGEWKEVDFLKCSRCGNEYYFLYHEYWHIERETKMWKKALLERARGRI